MRLIDVDALGVGRCSKDVLPAAYCAGWNGLINLLQAAPTVDAVSVVHGHWAPIGDGNMAQCSQCNELFDTDDTGGQEGFDLFCGFYKFCPCCGARMDGAPDA